MAFMKLIKSWTRLAVGRLMRGFGLRTIRQSTSLTLGEGNSHSTHLGGTRSYCSDKSKAIEDEPCPSGEPEADNYKWVHEKVTRPDRKRSKNEIGLGSSSTGATMRTKVK